VICAKQTHCASNGRRVASLWFRVAFLDGVSTAHLLKTLSQLWSHAVVHPIAFN